MKGSFITAQAFLPTRGKDAILIGVSSAAVTLPEEALLASSSYAGSKYALLKVMEILAVEFPDVHIVTIHPGVVETNMLEKSGMVGKLPSDTRTSRLLLTFPIHLLVGTSADFLVL